MSRLTYAEYKGLEGKIIKQVRWSNQEDYRALTISFADETILVCRFRLTIEEEFELADFKGGDI